MPQNRYYSSVAQDATLSAGVNSVATTITVSGTTGFPVSYPYTLVLDAGTGSQEVVSVTAAGGTTLTIVRGEDGTTAVAHSAGAVVQHSHSGRDFSEPQAHMAATTGVHGTSGALVGATNAQVLTNKDLTSGTNTFPASLVTSTTLSSHTGATAAHGATGAVVGTTNAQALTNKDLTGAGNTFPGTLATSSQLTTHASASTGVHGVTGSVVGTTQTQTLTNKDLSAASNTFPTTLLTVAALNNKLTDGATAGTTDAGGAILVTHNLGVKPVGVFVASQDSRWVASADVAGATTSAVNVYVRKLADGAILPSTSVTLYWLAAAL